MITVSCLDKIAELQVATWQTHALMGAPIHYLAQSLTILMLKPLNFVFPFWQLVILFGREGNQEANMGALLRMITTTTLSRASADLWNHTDAVHGCLALLGATFKKTPHLLTSHPNHLAPLFHLGKVSFK